MSDMQITAGYVVPEFLRRSWQPDPRYRFSTAGARVSPPWPRKERAARGCRTRGPRQRCPDGDLEVCNEGGGGSSSTLAAAPLTPRWRQRGIDRRQHGWGVVPVVVVNKSRADLFIVRGALLLVRLTFFPCEGASLQGSGSDFSCEGAR